MFYTVANFKLKKKKTHYNLKEKNQEVRYK